MATCCNILRRIIRPCLATVVVACTSPGISSSEATLTTRDTNTTEVSLDVWDWTAPANDLKLFELWVTDFRQAGGTRMELSVPWNRIEPRPGEYDLAFVRERADICRRHGLGMRMRINSYYGGAMPAWYAGDVWMDAKGSRVFPGMAMPSIADERFWKRYAPMCSAIARELRGQDVLFNAFIGVHAELKYADWWTYDESSLRLWREAIRKPRPDWLVRVAGDVDLPTTPPVPGLTGGRPDVSAASRAFIAFRERCWRQAVKRFTEAVRAGDPEARISSPLGESFRRESASFSNLDYWGMSRGAEQVVHSYDFFVHSGSTPQWHIAATIASFQGITGLPVCFEFDSPATIEKAGYDESVQKACVRTALDVGAGLKFANFSYFDKLPAQWPVIRYAGESAAKRAAIRCPGTSETLLLFFSKWANYCYREKTEWLHDAQFGWWKLAADLGIPSRIICEDNLGEDLSAYRGMVVAFSPLDLMPADDRAALAGLRIPKVSDVDTIPCFLPDKPMVLAGDAGSIITTSPLAFVSMCDPGGTDRPEQFGLKGDGLHLVACRPGAVVLGFPLGYHYLHPACDAASLRAVAQYALQKAGAR